MAEQMAPDEMRGKAHSIRLAAADIVDYGDEEVVAFRANILAGADALDRLADILDRDEEVSEDEGWHIGGAWGDYGEVVVPLRILSYVIGGELDQQVVSTDPGYAVAYAEQVRRAKRAEQRLADVIEHAEREASWASMQRENQLWAKLQKVLRIARWGGADR